MKENIQGYPGYHITEDGRVFSNKGGVWKLRKVSISNTGRLRVKLGGKWHNLARLVAKVYIPNPANLPVVMHLDNNPLNNTVSNLRWGTQSDNIKQAYNESRLPIPPHLMVNGEKHPSTKLTNQARYLIVDLYLNYDVPVPKISVIFGISKRHITKIIHQYRHGIRW